MESRGDGPARWANMTNQLALDKVYVEVQRDRRMTDEDSLENAKKFYPEHGVKVAAAWPVRQHRRRPVPLLLLHRSRRPRFHQERRPARRAPFR